MSGASPADPGATHESGDLLARATTSAGLRLLAVALGFAFTVLLARTLGPDEAGVFLLAFNVVSFLTIGGRLGLDDVVVRSVAADHAAGDWTRLHGVIRTSTRVTLVAASGLSSALWFTADWWAGLLDVPALAAPLRILALAVLPLALCDLWGLALRGLSHLRESQWVLFVNTRLLNLVGLALVGGTAGAVGIGWVTVGGAVVSVALSGWFLRRAARPAIAGAVPVAVGTLLSPGLVLFLITLLVMLTDRLSLLVLASFAGSADVGIFATALRTAGLLSLALHAMEVAVAPRFAALDRRRHHDELRRLAQAATRVIGWATVPAVLLAFVFRDTIMGVFGDAFVRGGWSLAILVAGQSAYAMAGPASSILVMSGHERIRLAIAASGVVICGVLTVALIPAMGLVGAALATAAAWSVQGALAAFAVFRLRGFWVASNPFRIRTD